MNTNFKYKQTCRGVDFCYTKTPVVDEREIHAYHEILYYIDGNATIICENFSKKLSSRSLIFIPKGCYHFLRCESPSDFERLKISFFSVEGLDAKASSIPSVKILEDLDEWSAAIPEKLCNSLQTDCQGSDAFMIGSFLMLLSVIGEGKHKPKEEKERDRLVTDTLKYIDANLTSDIDTEKIARAMRVSASSLSHVFKREMGIPLHKYVTEKRMILAKRIIEEGGNPTKIYSDCGYGDYSSFYKAYVKLFGHSPSGRGT